VCQKEPQEVDSTEVYTKRSSQVTVDVQQEHNTELFDEMKHHRLCKKKSPMPGEKARIERASRPMLVNNSLKIHDVEAGLSLSIGGDVQHGCCPRKEGDVMYTPTYDQQQYMKS